MKIDRSNYEIWLIDWLDGNLSNQDSDRLRLFLKENPDIMAETEDPEICSLIPGSISFQNKDLLKRLPSEISADQFEYLSVASMENDLSPAQQRELGEILNNDPAKRDIFEQIGKLRLVPGKVIYNHKNRLLRRTPAAMVLRMTVMALSAAAIVTVLISLYMLLPEPIPEVKENRAQLVPSEGIPPPAEPKNSAPVEVSRHNNPVIEKSKASHTAYSMPSEDEEGVSDIMPGNIASATRPSGNSIQEVKMIVLHPDVIITGDLVKNSLVALNLHSAPIDEEDPRSSIGRFMARNFRSKLLNEETPPDTPIKGFEIAEAGVAGINKIFGWEMELEKKKTESGETKSVYFYSRILKFNAPVKKAEPLASSE